MTVDIVLADDWQGIYVDGELKAEGHSLKFYDVLEALDIPFGTIHSCTDEQLPAKLSELKD